MKKSIALLGCLLSVSLFAQTNEPTKIAGADAKDYVGKNITVTGKVAEVHIAEKLVRLNFEKPFPNQTFTAVVFANKTNAFGDLASLKDKSVEVSGTISEYHGHPEIILVRTNQLKISTPK